MKGKVDEYGGGSNKDIVEEVEQNKPNPVEDFLACKEWVFKLSFHHGLMILKW